MNLVLYSGCIGKMNKDVDSALIQRVQNENPKMTYVPFTSREHPQYFERFKRYYGSLGVERFQYLAPDRSYSEKRLQDAFSTDIIYLSSGNTFTFLKHLRNQNLIPLLRKFIKNGGILAGASAGAIVMTPNIMTARVPSVDSDRNAVGLKNLKAMSLVNFEFSPHYSDHHEEELRHYSRTTRFPIIACDDGSGLVVENNRIRIVGNAVRFHKGRKFSLTSKYFQL